MLNFNLIIRESVECGVWVLVWELRVEVFRLEVNWGIRKWKYLN